MPITCENCGKNYPWQEKYASKKVRCKCGHVMSMPAGNPDEVLPAPEPVEEDTFDFKDDGGSAVAAPVFPPSVGVPIPQAGRAESGPQRSASVPKKKEDKHAAAEKQKVKMMITGVIGLGLVIGGLLLAFHFLGGSSTKPKGTGNADDDKVQQMIEDEPGYEMKKWALDKPEMRMVGGWSAKQAAARADRLYEMGAKKCYAFGVGLSLTFAIELPDDKTKRADIIDWANSSILEVKSDDSSRITDIGQRFLLLPAPR